MAAQCDVKWGHTMKEVHSEIREEIERILVFGRIYLLLGLTVQGPEKKPCNTLFKYFPLALIMCCWSFECCLATFHQPLIIFPHSTLVFDRDGLWSVGHQISVWLFCIAGWLGLLGMIIKNVVCCSIGKYSTQRGRL